MRLDELWAGAALLARWFRFAPREIDALTLSDFVRWLEAAQAQIKAERESA